MTRLKNCMAQHVLEKISYEQSQCENYRSEQCFRNGVTLFIFAPHTGNATKSNTIIEPLKNSLFCQMHSTFEAILKVAFAFSTRKYLSFNNKLFCICFFYYKLIKKDTFSAAAHKSWKLQKCMGLHVHSIFRAASHEVDQPSGYSY